jgi:hypothetical protein
MVGYGEDEIKREFARSEGEDKPSQAKDGGDEELARR